MIGAFLPLGTAPTPVVIAVAGLSVIAGVVTDALVHQFCKLLVTAWLKRRFPMKAGGMGSRTPDAA